MTSTVKLDWLTVTFESSWVEAAKVMLSGYLGTPERLDHSFRTYQECWRWPAGALLMWSPGRDECCLDLNGDAIDGVPLKWIRQLLKDVASLGARASRVDIALDDYGGAIRLDDVEAAAARGDFTGFKLVDRRRPQERRDGKMVDVGRGISFGRRGKNGGGRYVQFYDKGLESDGEIPSIRMELRAAKDVANDCWHKLLLASGSDEELARTMCQVLGGCIDFIERGDETHVDRMPRLGWWSAIVSSLGQAKLVVQRVIPPLQKSWEHIKKAVAPTLALIRVVAQSQGYDLLACLEDVMDQAEEKIAWKRQGKRDLGLNLVECFG